MKQLTFVVALMSIAASTLLAGGKATVSGTYAEARTAEVFAGGCVMNSEAGTAGRQAVLAWKVDRGSYNGVALDDLSVVAAVAGNQNLGIQEIGGSKAITRAAVYVDQRATPAQQMALVAMANEFSKGIVGTVVQVTASPIEFTENHQGIHVTAGQVALDVNKHMEHDASCGAMQWFQPLSSVNNATLGTTERHMFSGSALGHEVERPGPAIRVLRDIRQLKRMRA